MSDLFARVRPLVGDVLPLRTVAVMGAPAAAQVVEYLAACGVQQWVTLAGNGWIDATMARLRARFGAHLALGVRTITSTTALDADLAVVVDDWPLACRLPLTLPRLAVMTPGDGGACRAYVALAGESFTCSQATATSEGDSLFYGAAWQCAAPLVALWARALLLQGTVYAMPAWDEPLARGVRGYVVGSGGDPTQARWLERACDVAPASGFRAPVTRRGTLLIAGLGSLGSVAAHALAPWVARVVLVDPDHVEVANLVRQAYDHRQVGMAKAVALAEQLSSSRRAAHAGDSPNVVPLVSSLTDEAEIAALIREYEVDAMLVTTGTHADFALARAAYAAAIPHVIGRCTARARYWEAIVVDAPGRGYPTVSYAEMRRGVALGPTPAPTPEEIAAYGAVDGLVAEPATALETGWAAWWLARLMAQMLLPPALREQWLLARLAAGASCFVGGLVVEAGTDGTDGAAYGVRVPGEVHAWSAAEIIEDLHVAARVGTRAL